METCHVKTSSVKQIIFRHFNMKKISSFFSVPILWPLLWHPLHYFKRKLSYWYLIPSPYPHFLDGVPVQLWERGWLWWNQFIISYLHIINGPSIWYTHTYPRSGQLLKLTPIPFLCDLLVLFYISLFWTFPVALHRNYNYQLLNSFLLSTTSWCVAALVVIVKMWWPYLVSSRAGNDEPLQRLSLCNHGEGPYLGHEIGTLTQVWHL